MVEYTFLKFIPFSDLLKWDYKRYSNELSNTLYPFVKLGNHTKNETEKENLYDFPNQEFGILGISNEIGMFDAYIEKGKNINQAYKIVSDGFIAYNPYRINVGSIGIKTALLTYKYISPAYVVISCKSTLLPEFLFLLMKGHYFHRKIQDNTTGSVRQTLSYNELSEIQIPLPNLETQEAIVDKYHTTIAKAEEHEKQAIKLEASIEKYLFEELGIEESDKKDKQTVNVSNYHYLKLINLSEMIRWGVEHTLNIEKLSFLAHGKYQSVALRQITHSFQYGLSEKANEDVTGIPMLRMNNIYNSDLIIDNLKYLSAELLTTEKFILNKGDLLFNRTNSKELVGKTALFNMDGKFTFASYLIRVVINSLKANNYYINYLFNSSIIRKQIDIVSRQVLGQANINSQEMLNLQFPLPPLDIQNKIAENILAIKEQIKSHKEQAFHLRELVKLEFKNEVFGNVSL